jgi:hypothetical protein
MPPYQQYFTQSQAVTEFRFLQEKEEKNILENIGQV